MKLAVFHSLAERELWEAVAYYDEKRDGLGSRFQRSIEDAVLRIRRTPKAFSPYDQAGTRKYVVHDFPYNLFFVEFDDVIWIAAVAHHRRRPDYWRDRERDDG
jgi:toxin ParE1/3/4